MMTLVELKRNLFDRGCNSCKVRFEYFGFRGMKSPGRVCIDVWVSTLSFRPPAVEEANDALSKLVRYIYALHFMSKLMY